MKRQHFILLVVLLVVLGGGALFLFQRGQSAWTQSGQGAGQKVLGDFDVNSVARVIVRQSTNTLTLAKGAAGWVVKERGDYPANFDEIRDTLRKLAELKVVQTTEVGASQRPRLELAEPPAGGTNSGTLVELQDGTGKTLRSVLLGKMVLRQDGQPSPFGGQDGYPVGRYVLPLPAGNTVSVVSDTLTSLDPEASRWLSKDFFTVEKLRSVALAAKEPDNSWTLLREGETNAWTLADAKPEETLDIHKVGSVTGAMGAPTFSDVLVSPDPAATGLDEPTKITLTTFDGFTYDLAIGTLLDDVSHPVTVRVTATLPEARTPADDEKPEDKERLDREFNERLTALREKLKKEEALNGRTFLISKWTVEALLKNRPDLMQSATDAEPAPSFPTFPTDP